MLSQELPERVRAGIQGEQRKLQAMHDVLFGEQKDLLVSLRQSLRWKRVARNGESNPAKRKELDAEIADIMKQIESERKHRQK